MDDEDEPIFGDLDDDLGESGSESPTQSLFEKATVSTRTGVRDGPVRLADEDEDEGEGEDEDEDEDGLVTSEQLPQEVTDQEVDEFLAEMGAKPIQKPVGEGNTPLDLMPKDMTEGLDMFREMRMVPQRQLIYERGMPNRQMLITVKDRMQMLAAHADEGEWRQARNHMRVLWKKKRLRLPLGRILWNLMIKAHAKANRPLAAESWLNDMMTRIYQPDVISYNTLLNCLGRNGDFLKAEDWLRKMRARGVKPDMWSYSALANAYAEADDFDGVERTLYAIRDARLAKLNAVPFNAALKFCSQHGFTRRAESVLDLMERAGVVPDKVSYLLLIKLSSKNRDTEGAAGWLTRMEEVGLRPGRQHMHAVMTAHARAGDDKGVETWIQVMRDRQMDPDSYCYNIWLSAVAQAGKPDAVEAIVAAMEESGIEPDLVTFSTAIDAFAEAGDAESAKAWLLKAEDAGLDPDMNCYNQAIKACARAGNSEMADGLTRRLLRNRLTPDMYTYSGLLGALSKDGTPSLAEFWVDHMQRTARWRHTGFPAKQVSLVYADVLLAHARSGNLEAAEAWHSQMIGEGVEPPSFCYTAIAEGHLKEGRPKEARKWAERMISWSGHQPPQELLESLRAHGELLQPDEMFLER